MMRHGSLFSGIGGFDLAAEMLGWQNIFHCEKDSFCRKILAYHFPGSMGYEDIFKFNGRKFRGIVDIISAGFPCQPFSVAGRRKGKNDDRYLWPETIRVIREAKPSWIVLENVPGLLSIVNPESLSDVEIKTPLLFSEDNQHKTDAIIIRKQRRVIGSIIKDIQSAGYILPEIDDGTPIMLCLPACVIGAPHRRDRLFIVAYTDGIRGITAHSHSKGLEGFKVGGGIGKSEKRTQKQPARFFQPDWKNFATESPLYCRNDGIPKGLDGITVSKLNMESIKAYGNAVVPSLALEVFRAIDMVEKSNSYR